MFFGGVVGFIADLINIQSVILLLSAIALIAGFYARRLENVSG
jgi:hypothetical protein